MVLSQVSYCENPEQVKSLTMLSSLLLLAALLTPPALAIVEPLNTTILGPYGFVPPVYPSRKLCVEDVPKT